MTEEESIAHEFQLAASAGMNALSAGLRDALCELGGVVHHYTDATGLAGIVESGTLRATHSRFLNDTDELTASSKTCDEWLANAKLPSEVVTYLNSKAELTGKRTDVYVTCFSENPDLLSQWRAYAADGHGFALGVRLDDLTSVPIGDGFTPFGFVRVAYHGADQYELTELLLGPLVEKVTEVRKRSLSDAHARAAWKAFAIRILEARLLLSMACKSPAFAEEREWRMVALTPTEGEASQCLHFRSGRYGLTPYVELPLRDQAGKPLPIAALTLGPQQRSEWNLVAAKMLLRRHGSACQPVRSAASYR